MAFHGLFVGVDKYASPLISDLSCSARDAQALYGLFADTLGADNSTLLTNASATRDAVISSLSALSSARPDDFVFIHFSGHGSDTHHLVTHDADPMVLDGTALALEELVDLFSRIPARNVILCLDCCFAGGAGARVFHSPVASRDSDSAEALLRRIGGAGRVILTAAGADEAAIEDRRKGHGVFTYYLAEGLKGAPEVVDAGTVPFLALADFVTKSVESAAAVFRHIQKPALRGALDGQVSLPVLMGGTLYKQYFPDAPTTPVTSELESLLPYGFGPNIIERLKQSIPGLNPLQLSAVNDMALFQGEHLVVSAPTSSGKTMIGELAALRAHLRGERSYMLLPLRALVNDKYEDLKQKYEPLGLRVIRSTGEIADDNDALMRGKFDIALLTYERFAALAIIAPYLLRNVGLVVIDEVQMITDQGRGAYLEFLITYLRAQREMGIEPQMVALSAVIGDTNGFERWLGARLLLSTERPVPLQEGVLSLRGEFHYIDTDGAEQRAPYVTPEYRKGSSQDVIIPLVRQLARAGEKVIVFRETKPIVRSTAMYLANNLGLPPAQRVLQELPEGDPSAASHLLRQALQGGVAFHNADLDREEREAIERSFRDPNGEVKVLVATTTLAMGVNTPAWSVVIEGLNHPGNVAYSVAEYKNMVGRAGRLGWSPVGKAFVVAASAGDEYRLWNSYVRGTPEALHSRFAEQDVVTAVCRVLGTATAGGAPGLTEDETIAFLRSTFSAFLRGETWTVDDIRRAVARLENAGLTVRTEGRLKLTPLGEVAGHLGVAVESVVRLASCLRGLPLGAVRAQMLLAAIQTTVELDEVYLPVHRRSHQERARWQGVLNSQGLPHSILIVVRNAPEADVTARAKRFASVLMWIQGVELGQLEASLLQHLPSDNAAGPIRGVAERTRDLLGVAAKVVEILNPGTPGEAAQLATLVDDLALQLELGLPTEIVWLARSAKRALTRADYLALWKAGLREPADLLALPNSTLETLIRDERRRGAALGAAVTLLETETASDDLPMPAPPRD